MLLFDQADTIYNKSLLEKNLVNILIERKHDKDDEKINGVILG